MAYGQFSFSEKNFNIFPLLRNTCSALWWTIPLICSLGKEIDGLHGSVLVADFLKKYLNRAKLS